MAARILTAMMSPSPDAGDPILRALRTLPRDRRNTAPETRARFEYQDECIALLLLEHLADDLHGVLVEHSTDVILIPREGLPELVSVKHREPHHRAEPGWTWAALQKDRVLADLHAAWVAAGRACTVAFHSNAGFSGPAGVLRNATAPGDPSAVREAAAASGPRGTRTAASPARCSSRGTRLWLPHVGQLASSMTMGEDELTMVTIEEALVAASGFLAEDSKSWDSSDVRIIPEACFVEQGRLIVPYDHADYLDRGKDDMRLAGNLPIAVDLSTGECSILTWDEVDDFAERGLF